MTSTFIEPFDFRKIFIEYLLGDGNLFAIAFIILYTFAAAKYGFSNRLYLFFLLIGSVLFAVFMGTQILTLVVLFFGGFAFKTIFEYFNR